MVDNSIRITCLGDIAPIRQGATADKPGKGNCLNSLFSQGGVVFANLEAPLVTKAEPRENKKYNLIANKEFIDALPHQTVYSLANNHIMDYGVRGLEDTIYHLTKRGIRFTGAGMDLSEASKPVIIELESAKIGFLACADARYNPAGNDIPGTMPADSVILNNSIRDLKNHADIVYLSIHMGMEFVPVPTPSMRFLAQKALASGADVVFFHHAHCVSGFTYYDNKEKLVLWGVGNSIFPEVLSYRYKPWSEIATWNISHDPMKGLLELDIEPYGLDENGIPLAASSDVGRRILNRIGKISTQLNSGNNLSTLRLKYILSLPYLKILFSNYTDMARRKGILYVLRAINSSFIELFARNRIYGKK